MKAQTFLLISLVVRLIADAISSPRTRVDTAGFIILSNKSYDEAN
jgi:hypothetical protein